MRCVSQQMHLTVSVCAEEQTDILPFPLRLSCWRQWLTSFIKDCEGELSDNIQVTTAEGYPSALPLNAASFKPTQLRQGWRLQNREKNTGKPNTGLLYFVTETRCCLCSVAQHWQCLWAMKIKNAFNILKPRGLWNLSSLGKCTCVYLL